MRVLLALLALWAGAACANPDAQTLLARGYAFYEQGNYPDAIAVFRQAYALNAEPRFLLNIALCQEKMPGQCGPALATFERFIQACPTCDLRRAADEDHQRVRARCLARVRIVTEPGDAQVIVDDAPPRPAPLELTLPAGEHRLRVSLDGFAPIERSLHTAWSERATLVLALRPAADRSGQLQIGNVPPAVEVRLAGALLKAATLTVAPGPKTLMVTTPAGEHPLPVLVRPGGVTAVDLGAALVQPPVDHRSEAAWSAAVGGLGLATGVVFSALLAGDLSDERAATNRAAAEDAKDAAIRDAITAQIGFGVALAGLSCALTLWLISDDAP